MPCSPGESLLTGWPDIRPAFMARVRHAGAAARAPGLLVCVIALGAGTSAGAGADTVRFGLASAPVTLDPRFATDAASDRINRLLYDRLVDFDDGFNPVAAMATWERLEPTRYRFTLRPDRRSFVNGAKPDASDVVATYESGVAALESLFEDQCRAQLDCFHEKVRELAEADRDTRTRFLQGQP